MSSSSCYSSYSKLGQSRAKRSSPQKLTGKAWHSETGRSRWGVHMQSLWLQGFLQRESSESNKDMLFPLSRSTSRDQLPPQHCTQLPHVVSSFLAWGDYQEQRHHPTTWCPFNTLIVTVCPQHVLEMRVDRIHT